MGTLKDLAVASVHATRLCLTEEFRQEQQLEKGASGVSILLLARTNFTWVAEDQEAVAAVIKRPVEFLVKLTFWRTFLLRVSVELSAPCCGGELIAEPWRGPEGPSSWFCGVCHERYYYSCRVEGELYRHPGLADRRQLPTEDAAVLEDWLTLRSDLTPFETTLEAQQLVVEIVQAAQRFNRLRPASEPHLLAPASQETLDHLFAKALA